MSPGILLCYVSLTLTPCTLTPCTPTYTLTSRGGPLDGHFSVNPLRLPLQIPPLKHLEPWRLLVAGWPCPLGFLAALRVSWQKSTLGGGGSVWCATSGPRVPIYEVEIEPNVSGQEGWVVTGLLSLTPYLGEPLNHKNPHGPKGQYWLAEQRWCLGQWLAPPPTLLSSHLPPPSPPNTTTFGRKESKGSLFIKVTLGEGAGLFPQRSAQPSSLLHPTSHGADSQCADTVGPQCSEQPSD